MIGVAGLPPIPLYTTYVGDESKFANASLEADPQSSALLAYFRKVAPSITTPAALLKNYKALQVVLGAFGLQDKIADTAILRKLMTQDPKAKTSLAHSIGNAKYQLFANAMSNWNPPPFSTAAGVSQLAAAYTTNTFEQTANTQAPGLAAALYFTREAPSLKSVTAVQADQQLLSVVVTSLGLPLRNFELLDFGQQTKILDDKLKVSQFQNPAYVKHVAEQYLISQQSASSSSPAAGTVGSLYSDGADTTGDSVLTILDPSPPADGSGDGSGGSSGSGVLSLFA